MKYAVKVAGRRLALVSAMILAGMIQNAAAESVQPILIGGVASGGKTLVDTSGPDLAAGGLLYVGMGVLVEPADSSLMYQFSVGYKFDSVQFKSPNGDASISTYPVDAVALYKDGKFRYGGGVTWYLNPEYEICFDAGGCSTVSFDDALGLLVEGRFEVSESAFIGVRYTNVEYKFGGESVDASNVQFHLGVHIF